MVPTRMMYVHLPYSLLEWRESPLNLPSQVPTCFCPSGSPVPSSYVYLIVVQGLVTRHTTAGRIQSGPSSRNE